MNVSRNQLILGAIAVLVLVTVITAFLGFSFSVVVLSNIAAIAFMTVVAVMVIGAEHGHGPVKVEESAAATAWAQRVAERENAMMREKMAEEAAEIEAAGTAKTEAEAREDIAQQVTAGAETGQSVGDLTEAEKEAKRQAALERRRAREAKKSGE